MIRPLFYAAMLALAAVGCAREPGRLPDTEPYITGTITGLERAGERIGLALIEENPHELVGSAKAALRVEQGTLIVTAAGTRGDFNDLREGRRVRAWVIGPVAESYPVQARAQAIALEPR